MPNEPLPPAPPPPTVPPSPPIVNAVPDDEGPMLDELFTAGGYDPETGISWDGQVGEGEAPSYDDGGSGPGADGGTPFPAGPTGNALLPVADPAEGWVPVGNADGHWVTLENDQRIFIGAGGEFMPKGPRSIPVHPRKSPKEESRFKEPSGDGRLIEKFDESAIPAAIRDQGDKLKSDSAAEKALSQYTKGKEGTTPVHVLLNEHFRYDAELSDKHQETVKQLDRITNQSLGGPTVVYRGLGQSAKEFLRRAEEAHKAGQTIQDRGYGSTSLDFGIAARIFSDPTGPGEYHRILTQVVTKKGAYIAPTSHFDNEQEVLLPRNTHYRVTGIDRDVKHPHSEKWKYTIIRMEAEHE